MMETSEFLHGDQLEGVHRNPFEPVNDKQQVTIKRKKNMSKYRYSQFCIQGIPPDYKMGMKQVNNETSL